MDIVTFEFTAAFAHSVAIHLLVCAFMWGLVIAAISVDLWDRVYTQRKLGNSIYSHKLRKTIDKTGEYWRFLVIAFIIDAIIFISCTLLGLRSIPFVTILFTIVEVVIEVKSLIEHARERKSRVADLEKIVQTIVSAASEHDAKQAIKGVVEYIGEDNTKVKEIIKKAK